MAFRPRVAITMGDAAGIGPEITVKSLAHPSVTESCIPIVLGDARVLERAMQATGVTLPIRTITRPAEADGRAGVIELLDYRNVDMAAHQWGVVHAPQEGAEPGERVVVARQRRKRGGAFQERENLSALLVEPEHARRSLEADALEMTQKCVCVFGVRADRTANRVSDADDVPGVDVAADESRLVERRVTAVECDLVHVRSMRSSASCCSRRSRSASSMARIV